MKHLFTCVCDNNKPHICEVQEDCKGKLEFLWKQATENCQSNSLKNFLRKQGKLSSVIVSQGNALLVFLSHATFVLPIMIHVQIGTGRAYFKLK